MRYETKVTIYLHSDAALHGMCDCGDREWMVQLPEGWMWKTSRGPGPFDTLEAAHEYATSLYPNHPDVQRANGPDLWVAPRTALTEERP